jgi:protein-disulfide isomerase
MALTRRLALGAVALLAAACTKPASGPLPDDMAMGAAEARIEVVEYASVGCPVCARWSREIWPAFKAKYVDTGQVRYVLREQLVGSGVEVSVAAAGFLLARCAGSDKYFPVIEAVFARQDEAFVSPRETLVSIAETVAGMDRAAFDTCVTDETSLAEFNTRSERNAKLGGGSTPTFVINGVSMPAGYHALEEIDAAIAAAKPR